MPKKSTPDEVTIDVCCPRCETSGLEILETQADGTHIVRPCRNCKGTGKIVTKYKPFTGLLVRSDIETVNVRVRYLKGRKVAFMNVDIPYSDFLEGKFPKGTAF